MELVTVNLTKMYRKQRILSTINSFHLALDSFSYSFTPGIYGLLGPNGAGKSTLINIISSNIKQTSGSIEYDGTPIALLGAHYRGLIGYVPQQQGLYDSFTLLHFMRYIAALKGIPNKTANSQIYELLEQVNLIKNIKQRLGTFSGGMKQRALIAQALLGNPSLLLLDEPTSGLDPKERIRLRNLISEFSLNRIVIFATHVVTDIENIANKVIFLKEGYLALSGLPSKLCNELCGMVCELEVASEDLSDYLRKYRIISTKPSERGMSLRILDRAENIGFGAVSVCPQLEDVYLSHFDEDFI